MIWYFQMSVRLLCHCSVTQTEGSFDYLLPKSVNRLRNSKEINASVSFVHNRSPSHSALLFLYLL